MTKSEIELNNIILEQGWKEGAASPERLGSFLDRRMAALAIADADEDFTELAT
jgi:hypothetical protein